MAWIIDGHNLIPKIPGLNLSMPDDEEQLLKLLVEFARLNRKKSIVYFDGAPPGVKKVQNFGYVSAQFVRSGSSADEAISRKLRQLGKNARNWTVVSSDHSVQAEARSVGANIFSAKEFSRLLFQTLHQSGEGTEVSGENYPDEAETRQWLDLFKMGTEDEDG